MGARRNFLGPDVGAGSLTARLTGRSLIASPGLVASLLCWAGSVLLIVSAAIHLHLWSNGYDQIPTIGPLFLLQGIAGIVMALLVALSRHFLVALAGALFAAATIGGLVISVEIGLFGFQDSLSAPYATMSLVVEAAAFVVLLASAFIGMRRAGWGAHRPASGRET
ncbi:MAG TPA: hypothetical protein VIC86_03185 [Acidimicrobiales bacterium]|jgi:hypothetical protein